MINHNIKYIFFIPWKINFCHNVIGFTHEQGRPDRGKFIEIDFDAIAQFEQDEVWPNGTDVGFQTNTITLRYLIRL